MLGSFGSSFGIAVGALETVAVVDVETGTAAVPVSELATVERLWDDDDEDDANNDVDDEDAEEEEE